MKQVLFILLATGLLITGCNSSDSDKTEDTNAKTDTTRIINNPNNTNINSATVNTNTGANTNTPPVPTTTMGPKIPANKSTRWLQNEQEDQMTHKKIYFANLPASQPLHLKSGDVDAELILKNKDGKNETVLRIEKREFSKNKNNNNITAIFDSLNTLQYHSEVSQYVPNCLIIKDANKLIDKIKTSKKLILEADINNEGQQKIQFDIVGLNWNH